ncbi:hypothetical protein CMO83_02340 [Candidatus Woesearchaeota archaeon]|jgi:hypothetical protein|nr:hypothetical protein [Candidatus Woesearchaeota archaeon]MDP6648303.1 hypothetical protein [Candidatus Woesearchaeota archaeon]|tara:strand:- start:2701 stop:3567 length:867 start_codon:yes stop_codon:yes gene_type:complete
MLKSLFKKKNESNELLPPPPPFPSMELEEEKKDFSSLFDEEVKSKEKAAPEKVEFSDLVKDLEKGINPNKNVKKGKISLKQKKLLNKKLKQSKKAKSKQLKEKISSLKTKKGASKKPVITELPELDDDLGIEDIDISLPKELDTSKDIELPDHLEDFDELKEDSGKEIRAKPKEILEAENEIKDAIGKIKGQKRPSLFNRLFAKPVREMPTNEHSVPAFQEVDDISRIKNKIYSARDALMQFNLENAKQDYVEIMKLYNKLQPKEQGLVYQEIKDLYFERKSAEGLKV